MSQHTQLLFVLRENKKGHLTETKEIKSKSRLLRIPNSPDTMRLKNGTQDIFIFYWHMKTRKHLDLDGRIQRLLFLGYNEEKHESANSC